MNTENLWSKDDQRQYQFSTPPKADTILELASDILEMRFRRKGEFSSASSVIIFLRHKIGGLENEVFACLFLDNRHRLIEFEIMFSGSI